MLLDYIGVKTNPPGTSVDGYRDSYTEHLNTPGINTPSVIHVRIPPNMTMRHIQLYSEHLQHNVHSTYLSGLLSMHGACTAPREIHTYTMQVLFLQKKM